MMAEFLHEITKRREETARIDAMIIAQGMWDTQEEVMPPVWERVLAAALLPPAGEEPF
jgi:hypothetical protein